MDSKNREESEYDLDFITDIIRLVPWSIATSLFCILGLVSNVINIVVFYKQGMKSTVNITFMALSITDLINVIFMWWVSISTYPLLSDNVDMTFDSQGVSYLTGAFPHGCMSRVTAWITVFMTAERWLCIALPFKAKQWITPRRAMLAITAIYLFTLLPLIPEYLLNQLNWVHHQPLNKSIVGLVTNPEYTYLTGVSTFIYSILSMTSFCCIVVLTALFMSKLREISQFRKKSNLNAHRLEVLTRRDNKASRTVLVLACFLIVSFTPSLIVCSITFIFPDFNLSPLYNIYIVCVSISFLFDSVNASVNTLLYYIISSKYRQTLNELMCVL